MSWSTTTLSTSASIARHEKEISLQAGSTARWSIYVPGTDTVWFVSTDDHAILTYADESTATVTQGSSKIALNTTQYIIKIDIYDDKDDLLYSFECNEGYGATLTDTTGEEEITLVNSTGNWGSGWTETTVSGDYSWQDKLDLAKEIIGNRITTKLKEYGIYVSESAGEVYLDTLTNPETFLLACDYLTLSKIYLDLMGTGYNEAFRAKYEMYSNLYEFELAEALKRMNLDVDLSGSTDTYGVEVLGRLTR